MKLSSDKLLASYLSVIAYSTASRFPREAATKHIHTYIYIYMRLRLKRIYGEEAARLKESLKEKLPRAADDAGTRHAAALLWQRLKKQEDAVCCCTRSSCSGFDERNGEKEPAAKSQRDI